MLPTRLALPRRVRLLPAAALLGLAGAAALILAASLWQPALARPAATTITVTNTDDGGPGSLRAGLVSAGNGDTIVFSLPAGSVITVASELTVTTAITLDGSTASNLTLSGGGATRVLSATAPLRLVNLTIAAGMAVGSGGGLHTTAPLTLTGVTLAGNTANGRGGGLYGTATVYLVDTRVLTNTAEGGRGGGVYAEGSVMLDGGLFLHNRSAVPFSAGGLGSDSGITIFGTHFISNTAGDAGGAVRAQGYAAILAARFEDNYATTIGGGLFALSTTVISESSFIGNSSASDGAGAHVNGSLFVEGTLFQGNRTPAMGAGLFVAAPATAADSQVLGNDAGGAGGGIYAGHDFTATSTVVGGNRAGGHGGGLLALGRLALTDTQFLDNVAGGAGGGVRHGGGDGRLVNVLVAQNTASGAGAGLSLESTGLVEVVHATVAGYTANPNAAIAVLAGTVEVTNTILAQHALGLSLLGGTLSEDYNLYFSTPISVTGGVTLGVNSRLGDPRFLNPAVSDYHLRFGSAAADFAIDLGVLTDLDGQPRPSDAGFDVGCYELYAPPIYALMLPAILR